MPGQPVELRQIVLIQALTPLPFIFQRHFRFGRNKPPDVFLGFGCEPSTHAKSKFQDLNLSRSGRRDQIEDPLPPWQHQGQTKKISGVLVPVLLPPAYMQEESASTASMISKCIRNSNQLVFSIFQHAVQPCLSAETAC